MRFLICRFLFLSLRNSEENNFPSGKQNQMVETGKSHSETGCPTFKLLSRNTGRIQNHFFFFPWSSFSEGRGSRFRLEFRCLLMTALWQPSQENKQLPCSLIQTTPGTRLFYRASATGWKSVCILTGSCAFKDLT